MGVKVRFDGLDVMAMVNHLNHVALGRRVINIYEGDSNDAYLFKFDHSGHDTAATNNKDEEKEKLMLYLESGVRFHVTNRTTTSAGGGAGQSSNKNTPLAPFVFQLRKQLRGLRLEQVTQLGQGDRVVHFVFGMGEQRRALLLELYAKGNLVLTDANYQILALLRSHQYAGDTVQVKVGHVYPVTYAARNVVLDTSEAKEEKQEIDVATTEQNGSSVNAESSAQEWATWAETQIKESAEDAIAKASAEDNDVQASNNNKKGKGQKKKSKKDKQAGIVTLKTLLLKSSSGISHFGPNFLEHCILMANMEPHVPLQLPEKNTTENNLPSVAEWQHFIQVLQEESAKLDEDPKSTSAAPPKGFVLYSMKDKSNVDQPKVVQSTANDTKDTFVDKVLEEFQPYLLLKQHEGRHAMEFNTFNDAVDTFFGHLEAQKRLMKAEAAEQAAKDKLEKVRRDQQARIEALEEDVLLVQEQAEVVELNAINVDKALVVVNSALDSGMDWEQLEQLVRVEQEENRNPIALLIHRLDLENDSMVLELPNTAATGLEDEEDEDGQDEKDGFDGNDNHNRQRKDQTQRSSAAKKNHVLVSVSLKESAHGNASDLFAKYRTMKEKTLRTIEASTKALKAAEETAQRQLADAQQRTQAATHTVVAQVKPPWFTKFHWFVTSDNYLVLGGRDAHQNEVLVKKYLRPGDAYLHADVHGAASCILRAKRMRIQNPRGKRKGTTTTQTLPVSDQALREAGNFCICRSSAWSSKMVTSAWWVESHQVSKTAPTGEFLNVGAFMIRGKKNFLPPSQLEMGLGVMFRLAAPDGQLDAASAARHKNERRDFALMEFLQQQEDDDEDSDDASERQVAATVSEKSKTSPAPGESQNGEALDKPDNDGENREENAELSQNGDIDSPPTFGESEPDSNSKEDTGETPSNSNAKKKEKKGLSVKERKLIKKYGSLEEAERLLAEREKEEKEKQKLEEIALLAEDGGDEENEYGDKNNTASMMKRGKKGKKKKLMTKYADQDEEDRELAMLALQGGEKIKKKDSKDKRKLGQTTEEQKQAAAETAALLLKDAGEYANKLPEDVREVLAQCVTVKNKEEENVIRWDKFDADILDQLREFDSPLEAKVAAAKRLLFLKNTTRVDNFSASLAGILRTIKKYGHKNLEIEHNASQGPHRKTKEEKRAENTEWKQTLADEGVLGEEGEDEDMDVDDTAELNKLTGKPFPEDALLYALPVCAPYSTLSQYTYRVKLTPGNVKRGKAAKQCVEMFLRGDTGAAPSKASSVNEATRDLIKKVPDNDWGQVMCSDVKISAAGASKAIKKQKANNKAKAKKKK